MVIITPGKRYDSSNPVLVFYAQRDGWLQDLAALEFQIWDVSDDNKFLNPVQVYPSTAGDRAPVDMAADRLGRGRYCASFDAPAGLLSGRHELRWFWRWETGGDEQSAVVPCEVIAATAVFRSGLYASVSDLRGEGVEAASATDARLLRAIAQASAFIERVTGRFFEPRYLHMRVDGKGSPTLHLSHPIIAVDTIEFPLSTIDAPDCDSYAIRNRHLAGVLSPDDRSAPRIDVMYSDLDLLSGAGGFTRGKQNIGVHGVFGFTDPDGSPFGTTPLLVTKACLLLAMRDVYAVGSDERESVLWRHRIIMERTRDQQYQLAPAASSASTASLSGDPEIDTILRLYMRPPMIGAA